MWPSGCEREGVGKERHYRHLRHVARVNSHDSRIPQNLQTPASGLGSSSERNKVIVPTPWSPARTTPYFPKKQSHAGHRQSLTSRTSQTTNVNAINITGRMTFPSRVPVDS